MTLDELAAAWRDITAMPAGPARDRQERLHRSELARLQADAGRRLAERDRILRQAGTVLRQRGLTTYAAAQAIAGEWAAFVSRDDALQAGLVVRDLLPFLHRLTEVAERPISAIQVYRILMKVFHPVALDEIAPPSRREGDGGSIAP